MTNKPCSQIIVIGGGPVGLWTALQLKKRNPLLEVIVHEKYDTYRRAHVINLKQLSMLLYARHSRQPDEIAFYQRLMHQSKPNLAGALKGGLFIRTKELEEALKEYAEKLGIILKYKEIKSAASAQALYPDCRIFIGADGAHSMIRREMFGDQFLLNMPLQHVIELKYDIQGKADPLTMVDHYRTIKLLPYLAFEHIGKEKNRLTPVTLRFFVPPDIYAAIGEASFKHPVILDANTGQIPAPLFDAINLYLTIRQERVDDHPVPMSLKLSKLTLSIYAARHFALRTENTAWFLVGDAAMGVPYFRSLNSGFICGSRLAQLLTRCDAIGAVKRYALYAYLRIILETGFALSKNICLVLYRLFVKASSVVPWQVAKWSGKQIQHYGDNLYLKDPKDSSDL